MSLRLLFKIPTPPPERPTVSDSNFREHYSSVQANMSWGVLLTDIKKVTRDIIVPVVTAEFYEELSGKYFNGGVLSDEEAAVLELLQDAIAEYTMWKVAQKRRIATGDLGTVRVQGKEGMANQTQAWEYYHFYFTVMVEADKHLDAALFYLETHLEAFPTYRDNRVSFMYQNMLVRHTMTLQKYVNINSSPRTFKALSPSLWKAQREVYTLLGANQFADILLQVQSGEIVTESYKGLLTLIEEYCSHFAIWHAIPYMRVLVENNGLFVLSSTEGMLKSQAAAQNGAVIELREQAEKDWKTAFELLQNMLHLNVDDFPIWKEENQDEVGNEYGYPLIFGDGAVFMD